MVNNKDNRVFMLLYCLNSASPRNIPGWIVVVRENFLSTNGLVANRQLKLY